MSSTRIRTVIVDDEAPARALLRQFLAADPDIEIAAECADGVDAVRAIEATRPELVLLDVEMPELDGFGVLRALDPARVPNIVFVTAYDRYAVQAFDSQALDYLLKPFDEPRFQRALARAKARVLERSTPPVPSPLGPLLEKRCERFLVRAQDRLLVIRSEDIVWAEVDGNYVTLHVGSARYQLRQTLEMLEKQLDPARFQRIQRSILVNLDFVRELSPLTRGDYLLVMRDGRELKLSRNYRAAFDHFPGASL
jgi:two-component system LytT family response regulator